MSVEQVTAIMGPPYLVKSQNGVLHYTWSYADAFAGARAVSVDFKDGKVVEAPPIPSSF